MTLIALRILIGLFLLILTVWLIIRYAPTVGNVLGNILVDLLFHNSKNDR